MQFLLPVKLMLRNPSVQCVNCTTSASIGPIQADSASVPTMTTQSIPPKKHMSLSQQLTTANFPMFTVRTQASKQNNNPFTTNIVKVAHRNCSTKSAAKIVLFWSLWSWPHHDSSPANPKASLNWTSQLQRYSWWAGVCDWLAKIPALDAVQSARGI